MKEKAKTIGINMSKDMAQALESRSKSMHLSTSKYCKMVLAEWLKSGDKLRLEEKI